MVRFAWVALGVYFSYVAGLIGVNALISLHAPPIAPVSGSLAALGVILPLLPLKRHGFLSP